MMVVLDWIKPLYASVYCKKMDKQYPSVASGYYSEFSCHINIPTTLATTLITAIATIHSFLEMVLT